MKKTVDEINKMIMEDAPMEEINDAIGYIDICTCKGFFHLFRNRKEKRLIFFVFLHQLGK